MTGRVAGRLRSRARPVRLGVSGVIPFGSPQASFTVLKARGRARAWRVCTLAMSKASTR